MRADRTGARTTHEDVIAFLNHQKPLAGESVLWDNGRLSLHVTSDLSSELLPLGSITSVRAVVLQGASVLVVRDPESIHVLPGGRREARETLLQTLGRELLEETGWLLTRATLLGFKRFQHLGMQPSAAPSEDFIQIVYTAQVGDYGAAATAPYAYELEATFLHLTEAQALPLTHGERLSLNAAARSALEKI